MLPQDNNLVRNPPSFIVASGAPSAVQLASSRHELVLDSLFASNLSSKFVVFIPHSLPYCVAA